MRVIRLYGIDCVGKGGSNLPILELKNVTRSYKNGQILVEALKEVSLEIEKGEFVSIIGPSGSGKSTLLNMIGALDTADEGLIRVDGNDLSQKNDLSDFRSKKIGFIFQLHNLIPNLNVLENVTIPMYGNGYNSKQMSARAMKLLKYVKLQDKATRKPTELSGGERQRVAIARALANKPSIVLADEPTGSLDSKNGQMILKRLKELHEKENVTLIMVTHDMNVASMADRTIKVLDGKIQT
mgnify:CR=1 FL=1